MLAATSAVQRPLDAKLLVVDAQRNIIHVPRSAFVEFLRPNDLVIANDAATLPASLTGIHQPTGEQIEVRLAGRPSLDPSDVSRFSAVVCGEGDFHTRTENRPLPPPLQPGDTLILGPLHATVAGLLGHPRLVSLLFQCTADEVLAGAAGFRVNRFSIPTCRRPWSCGMFGLRWQARQWLLSLRQRVSYLIGKCC